MAEDQAAIKKKKYLYIMENAAENGYDTSKFNAWLNQKFVCKSSDFTKLIVFVNSFG